MLKIGKVYKLKSTITNNILLLKNFDEIPYDIELMDNFTFILLSENDSFVSKDVKDYYSQATFIKILFNGKIRALPIATEFLLNGKVKLIEVD